MRLATNTFLEKMIVGKYIIIYPKFGWICNSAVTEYKDL